jgi:hypothetical protein
MNKTVKLILAIIFLLLNVDLVLATDLQVTVTPVGLGVNVSCQNTCSGPPPPPVCVPPQILVGGVCVDPPPPPSDPCTAQGLVNTVIPLDWGAGTVKAFNIASGHSISFVLNSPTSPFAGTLSTVYGGSTKIISISQNKCDFSQTLVATNCMVGGSNPAIGYANVTTDWACTLVPGRDYYANVRNAVMNSWTIVQPIIDSCTAVTCGFSMQY